MKLNILFGGKAGQGPNIIGHILAEVLVKKGYYAFYSREYESLIRGGHNFNVLTFSEEKVFSNESKIDIIVCLDENSFEMHKDSLKKEAIILKGRSENMHYLGCLFKIFGFEFKELEEELKKLKNFEENLKNAREGYEKEKARIKLEQIKTKDKNAFLLKKEAKHPELTFINGSQGIAEGAVKSGLDIYYAYPMTPATPVLTELAGMQEKNNFLVLELENEIACINSALGSAMTGAKAMTGTSGGGFNLMTEALSLSGQAEIPLVIYLATRPGPSTGLPTYTSQGDLNLALHSGHGEFNRIVLAPGNPVEAEELTSEAFYFSQKYKIPCIILCDKHLAESFFTNEEKAKLTKSEKLAFMKKYNSYEHTEDGLATENTEIIKKNFEKRMKTSKEIEKEAGKFSMYKIYGNKKSKNVILGFGSTKGAILDAMPENCMFIQVLYLEPFPNIKNLLENKNIILVENSATGQLARLLTEKTGIFIEDKNKILRYDGKPFLSDELKREILLKLN